MRAWLELARLSNLPTCVTNVLVGAAIGGMAAEIGWIDVAAVAVAVMLFYVGGMTLNDVVDRRVDLQQRPGRPIPSGRITVQAALVFATACLAGGVALTGLAGVRAVSVALPLVAVIVIYDLVHKRAAASVLLMGLCRGLVYLLAATAVASSPDRAVVTTLAVTITAYVALLSIVARAETGDALDARRWIAVVLVPVALTPVLFLRPDTWAWSAVAAVVLTGWLLVVARHALARPPRTRVAVPGWLAGICLMDMLYLALLDRPGLAAAAFGCFVVTTIAHRRILGT